MANHYPNLNPEKALIWRIVHCDNLPWILDNGLHCANSPTQAPAYITIGNAGLITRRTHREVPIAPGGTLADYVPFYIHAVFAYDVQHVYGAWRSAQAQQ